MSFAPEPALVGASLDLTTLLELAPDPVIALDADWRVVYANASAARLGAGVSAPALRAATTHFGAPLASLWGDDPGNDFATQLRAAAMLGVPSTLLRPSTLAGAWRSVHVVPHEGGVALYFRLAEAGERAAPTPIVTNAAGPTVPLALDTIPGFAWVRDGDSHYVAASESLVRVFGTTQAEIVGRSDFDFFPADVARRFREQDRHVMATGEASMTEDDVAMTSGHVSWYESLRLPHRDAAGAIVGTIGIARDVTRRKATEEALRASQAELGALVAAVADVTLVLDGEGRYVKVAPPARDRLYAPEASLVGRTLHEVFAREAADEFLGWIRDALHSRQPVKGDYTLSIDGQTRWFTANIVPMSDNLVVWLARDETERRVAEKQLRRSEEYFRALTENASEMICVLDNKGTLVWESASNRHLLGYDPEELVGRSVFEMLHPDDVMRVIAAFGELIATPGATTKIECRFRHANGSWALLAAMAANLVHDPVVGGVVVNARDITAQSALEEQLRQAQKMEAVGRLAGGIAHDFNNLLTAIATNTHLAMGDLPEGSETYADLEEIRRATDRAAQLTRQLLAFGRKQMLEPRVLDLNAVVLESEKMLRRVIGDDVTFVTALDDALGAVRADPGQLEQVLLNLALNARDAMPAGGTLRLATFNAEVDADAAARWPGLRPGSYASIAISDTGCGMAPDVLERVFEPFFTTKDVGKGSGLGLAMVYGIVKQSGGSVFAESAQGEGSTFVIHLPRTSETPDPLEPVRDVVPAARGTGTVLLVEDENAVRMALRRSLERQGYVVLEATSGLDALAVWERNLGSIDLVLTDVVMPGLDGRELIARLRARDPSIRALLMSGYDEEALAATGARALASADEALIRKPFASDDLMAKLQTVLAR